MHFKKKRKVSKMLLFKYHITYCKPSHHKQQNIFPNTVFTIKLYLEYVATSNFTFIFSHMLCAIYQYLFSLYDKIPRLFPQLHYTRNGWEEMIQYCGCDCVADGML